MAESGSDPKKDVTAIAVVSALTAVLIALLLWQAGSANGFRHLAAWGPFLWLGAIVGYFFWVTRTLYIVKKQQKEILDLLKQRDSARGE